MSADPMTAWPIEEFPVQPTAATDKDRRQQRYQDHDR